MKSLKQILTSLSVRGVAVGALLLGASVQTSQAGSADPSQGGSFTWDLVSSGAGQNGITFITFTSDGTFHGYQMLSATPPANANTGTSTNSSGGSVGRGGGSTGRGGGSVGRGGGANGGITEILFGFGPISGTWTTTSKGQIVGALNQIVQVTSVVTNYLASTNSVSLVNNQTFETTNVIVVFAAGQASVDVSINWPNPPPGFTQTYTVDNTKFTTAIGSTEVSDTVSFTGKAVVDKNLNPKSLTLVCSTGSGHINYRGVPAPTGTTVDLTGDWIGTRSENGTKNSELFTLTSFQVDNPFPSQFPDIAEFQNIYFTTNGLSGSTPFIGVVMVSQQKHVGFTFQNDDESGALRSMIGTLKPTQFGTKATAKGIDEPFNLVNFTATLQ